MSRGYLNLAAQPFVNTRPVVRLSILLWLVGLLFLAGNVWLYWDFLTGRSDVHARLAEVDRSIASERQRIGALDREIAGFDLEQQNDQAKFLNDRIERRRFSWSRLFDELTAILPKDVRLHSLRPAPAEEGKTTAGRRVSRSAQADQAGDRVLLNITAQARKDQAILDFVDALFANPSFENPDLQRQATENGGLISFNLDVIYRHPPPGAAAKASSAGDQKVPSTGAPRTAPNAGAQAAPKAAPASSPVPPSRSAESAHRASASEEGAP